VDGRTTKPEGPENEIILSQNDHEDFSAILQQVIPDCPERLKTFLTSQRYAVLRKSTVQSISRFPPFWKTEYLVELSFHLLKAHPHILQVTNFYSLLNLISPIIAIRRVLKMK
jgi:hypothetical protein